MENSEPASHPEHIPQILGDQVKLFRLLKNAQSLENVVITDKGPTFQNIDNLVFQGGGVKGVAYLGVVRELSNELHTKHKVIENIKRVAGTSAGSMVALYISLGMEVWEIETLLIRSFAEYLDDDIEIEVDTGAPKPKDTLEDFPFKYKIKHILGRALEFLGEVYRNYKSSVPSLAWSRRQINELVYHGMEYYDLLKNLPLGYRLGLMLPGVISYQFGVGKSILKGIESLGPMLEDAEENCHKYFQKKDVPPLEGKVLHIAIAKLLGVTFFSSIANNIKKIRYSDMIIDQASMFTGTLVKTRLIYEPIRRQIKAKTKLYCKTNIVDGKEVEEFVEFNPMSPPFNIEKATFDDLDRCFDAKQNKCFKLLYVTAFNSRTLQTEVFSVEHTPHVVVADAVRASMGIPVFFTSTSIREGGKARHSLYKVSEREEKEILDQNEALDKQALTKTTELEKKEILDKKKKIEVLEGVKVRREKIRYMDGGIFDNFAMWIFDDLRYCSGNRGWRTNIFKNLRGHSENPEWEDPFKRVHIENPRTIGFKLFDGSVKAQAQQKNKEPIQKKINTSTDLAKSLLGAVVGDYEENVFSRGNQLQRTVFVDNNGVSTFAFQALPVVQGGLIESGVKAVREYLRVAAENIKRRGGQ